MRRLTILAGFLCCLNLLPAQRMLSPFVIGVEQDALPYLLKGAIFTGWMGRDAFRQRVSVARAVQPEFVRGEGITQDRVSAFGYSFEYFFRRGFTAHNLFTGFWIGPGLGYWRNDVTSSSGLKIKHESLIFSLGGGYNIDIFNWLYFSPWVAVHSRISGTDPVAMGADTYRPMRFTPEVSLKLGVKLVPRNWFRTAIPHPF